MIGGDTRSSTPILTSWLVEGLSRVGAQCIDIGVLPTPAVAFNVRKLRADTGIAISASHNPHHDNGIKLISADGFKWSREREIALEQRMILQAPAETSASGEAASEHEGAASAYIDHLVELTGGEGSLAGLEVAIDAANGAASSFASQVYARLGAKALTLNDRPDGSNINLECGSNHPEVLAARTRETGADFGIAFDGDADRAVLSDENGEVRDGDAILYLWATDLQARNKLIPRRIVATTMSNLGLERALDEAGIGTVRCGVGDRTVVEAMRREGIDLGGEQSGHIVHLPSGTTGDGLLTSLQIARILHDGDRSLSERLTRLRRYPQLLHNIPVHKKVPFADLPKAMRAASAIEDQLGSEGRLVLRYSGTEPLARIMLEGPEQATIERMALELAEVIQEELS